MIPHSKPTLGHEEAEAAARVVASGHLAQGPEVAAFEQECAQAFGRNYAVAVSSGTAALHLVLAALDVQPAEAVAIPSYSCAALATAITLQQGTPALCDVGPDFNLAPETIPAECRVAVVPHLFGAPACLPTTGIVIEATAQALGGDTGRASLVAITSFYVTKMMTTAEGGMVLTDDKGLAEFVEDKRDYDKRDDFQMRYPYKMTDVQAAIGRVQLKRLPEFVARRRQIAAAYSHAFRALRLGLPEPKGHVFFRYVISTPDRDALERHLNDRGVDAKRPVYRPSHHYLGGTFPGAERAHREGLSLPIFPTMLDDDVTHVIESVLSFIP